MRRLRAWFIRIAGIFNKSKRDRDFSAELESHLQLHIYDNLRAGMSPQEARRRAIIKLGGIESTKENHRDRRGIPIIETTLQDVRFGLRMMRKNPGFTLVAVVTLALGIGANTAIFSAVNGILIEHLPYADASRLLEIRREQMAYEISFAEVHDIQEGCPAFESVAVYHSFGPVVLSGSIPARRFSSYVSGNFFPMLGVEPLLGRTILPDDTQAGKTPVAVLSYHLWMDEFGGDPAILGREILVEKDLYAVIGVMPKEFEIGVNWGGDESEGLWMPLTPPPVVPGKQSRDGGELIARVKRGVPLSVAKAQLQVLSDRFATTFPKGRKGLQLQAKPPSIQIRTDLRTGLLILLGAVGFVLLMASVNVSALLVARARTRQNELAIRKTLGASRIRIVRQLLAESLLLALAGGALGLLFSVWGIRALRAIAPPGTPRVDRIHVDHNVLWFTLAISLLSAILFGLLPAIQASSRRMWGVLMGGHSGAFGGAVTRQRHSLRSALVIAEVALAVILVAGGALMARSFEKLMRVDTGVRADHVLTMYVQLHDFGCTGKDQDMKCPLKAEEILDGIVALPGVERAALALGSPLNGGFDWQDGINVEGVPGKQPFHGLGRGATPGFFATSGIRLLAGRDFVAEDIANKHPVAIVSEGFARKYITGNPLGRRFSTHDDTKGQPVWTEIVGEVNDTRDRAVSEIYDGPSYYTPFYFDISQWEIVARTTINPMSMAKAIESVVWATDKTAPITNVKTVDQMISDSAAQPKFQAVLLGSFSALGLFLAMIGIYGVISYSVIQRTHEIGVRVALGAQPRDVMRLVLGQGAILATIGIGIGLAGALALTRFLQSQLFEIKANDPVTFAGVAILLMVAALLACYIPARRATRVDPMIALRYE
jgi:predicted permease